MHDDHYDYDEFDDGYSYWREKLADELYEEHRDDAIADFTDERMQSYYLEHRSIDRPARDALNEARELLSKGHPTAAFLFAQIATEVVMRDAILKPVVCGLVHSETAAQLIADLVAGHSGFDRFRDLLFLILREHGHIDLSDFKRESAAETLWSEFRRLQKHRNLVVHRAQTVSRGLAEHAISVAEVALDTVFPRAVRGVGLDLRDDGLIWQGRHLESLFARFHTKKDGEA